MSKATKDYVIEQYRLLGSSNGDLIGKFATYYREQVITLDDLYALGKPNQKQAIAMFGGYCATKFAMTSESISDFVSVFSGAPQEVLVALTNATDLPSLVKALSTIEKSLADKDSADHALEVASGKAHEGYIKSMKKTWALAVADGQMNQSNLSALKDLVDSINKAIAEHRTQELASVK